VQVRRIVLQVSQFNYEYFLGKKMPERRAVIESDTALQSSTHALTSDRGQASWFVFHHGRPRFTFPLPAFQRLAMVMSSYRVFGAC
jgi:hypothetical protein